MASFKIEWRRSTRKDFRGIPSEEVTKIIAAVEQLSETPHPSGSQKLAGSDHTYRIRVGNYRVVYEVLPTDGTIEIQRVGHRKDVYR